MTFVILVVDDDPQARRACVAALEGDSFRVLTARSGTEAMALVARRPGIDLIFTEVVMPGIGGFMLADMARLRRPDIKILYTSGFREIADLKVDRLVGALLPKPVAPADLRAALQQALQGAPPAPLPDQPADQAISRRSRGPHSPSLGV